MYLDLMSVVSPGYLHLSGDELSDLVLSDLRRLVVPVRFDAVKHLRN